MARPNAIYAVLAMFLAGVVAGCAPGMAGYDAPGADLGLYDTWDADRSGLLDANEFYAGTFDLWEADDDGLVSEEEFGLATDEWLGGAEFGAFDDWDVDGSGPIDNDEFYDGVADFGA